MSVPIECPKCRHLFHIPDEYVGRKGKCPKCAHVFRAQAEEVETFPAVESSPEELPTMPVVNSGKKSAAKPPSIQDSSDEIPTFVALPAKKSASGKVAIGAPPSEKPGSGEEIPSFTVLPSSKSGSASGGSSSGAAKSKPAKASSTDSTLIAFPSFEKESLPKGSAKSPGSSESAAPLPKIEVGGGGKSTSGPHPALVPGHAAPGAVPAPAKDTPAWIPMAIVGGGIALVAIGLIVWSQMGSKPPVATTGTNPATTKNPTEKEPTKPGTSGKKPETGATEPLTTRTPDPAAIAATHGIVGGGIVKIEVTRRGTKSEGLGTVIDERGWIVTSYELVSGADAVTVHFQNATTAEGKGTVAVDSQHGLALVAVEMLPAGVTKRPIAPTNPSSTQICFPAVNESGKPSLKDTMVITFQKNKELPFTVQKSLGGDLRRDDDLAWIDHDVPVTASGTGGPLFDARGNLAGVRLPLSGAGNHGYAIPGKYVTAIVSQATGELTPFDPSKVASIPDPSEKPTVPNPPETNPTPEPTPPTNPDDARRTKQLARLEELIKTGDARRFSADSAEQYAELREIAELIFDLSDEASQGGLPEAEKTRIEAGRDAALEALGDYLWPEEIGVTNKQAVEGLKIPGKGFFGYIEILANQDKTFLAQVSGTEEVMIFNASQNSGSLGQGGRYLVLGRHIAGASAMAMIGDQKKTAFAVNAKHLIGKPLP